MTELEIKTNYNNQLKRWKKYEAFVNDKNVSMDEKLKWVPQAQGLTTELSNLIEEMKQHNYTYTDDEVLHGFLL